MNLRSIALESKQTNQIQNGEENKMPGRKAKIFFTGLVITILSLSLKVSEAFAENSSLVFGSTANLGALPLIAKHQGIFAENKIKIDY